ncbi:hypothetical protein HMPREF9621_01241 [Cutibacterium modestum HL037PA2]|nr:hypothetical protein HMPREF9621_01241 [Cutibacterium modestum HL037PA2]
MTDAHASWRQLSDFFSVSDNAVQRRSRSSGLRARGPACSKMLAWREMTERSMSIMAPSSAAVDGPRRSRPDRSLTELDGLPR